MAQSLTPGLTGCVKIEFLILFFVTPLLLFTGSYIAYFFLLWFFSGPDIIFFA
jgi:hypothetical protein